MHKILNWTSCFVLAAAAMLLMPRAEADVIVAASNQLRAVDSETGKELGKLELGQAVFSLAFSPDGATIYVGGLGGKDVAPGVVAVDTATMTVRRQLTHSPVKALHISADGKTLYILEWDVDAKDPKHPVASAFRMVTYDIPNSKVAKTAELTHDLYDAVVSPDGSTIFALNLKKDVVQVHDATGKLLESIAVGKNTELEGLSKGLSASVSHFAIAPGGKLIVVRESKDKSEILSIDMKTRKVESFPIDHGMNVRSTAVTPAGTLLLDAVKHLYAIDLASKKEVANVALELAITRVSLTNDGGQVILSAPVNPKTKSGALEVRDAKTLEKVRDITVPISPWVVGTLPAGVKPGGE